jgi:hyperosmotically inducible periplasmic protein
MKMAMRFVLIGAVFVAATGIQGSAAAGEDVAGKSPSEVTRLVRKALERLPYYGVFDFLAFSVEDGTVTLQGYAHRSALKKEAEDIVRRTTGAEVANKIEVLPVSPFDERIRWETYLRVYSDEFASRAVSGGRARVLYEVLDMARFPGMEPYGNYPVHIVVKNRRVSLFGVVDTEFDKTSVLLRARQTGDSRTVDDYLMISRR